jgi:hypothetical protein
MVSRARRHPDSAGRHPRRIRPRRGQTSRSRLQRAAPDQPRHRKKENEIKLIAHIELELGHAPDPGALAYRAVKTPLEGLLDQHIPYDLQIRTLSGVSVFHPVRITVEEGD